MQDVGGEFHFLSRDYQPHSGKIREGLSSPVAAVSLLRFRLDINDKLCKAMEKPLEYWLKFLNSVPFCPALQLCGIKSILCGPVPNPVDFQVDIPKAGPLPALWGHRGGHRSGRAEDSADPGFPGSSGMQAAFPGTLNHPERGHCPLFQPGIVLRV